MKVLVGQSYYLRFDEKLWKGMQPYPPLGSLYAAACLREAGFDVVFFDAMLAGSEDEWRDALHRERPNVAVLFEDNFNYFTKMCLTRMRKAAFTMIRAAGLQGCTVLVCGSDPSDHPEKYTEQGADFILKGEGEQTLVELMHLLSRGDGTRPESIPGLAFGDSGRLVETASRPVLHELDSLPFPAWDFVDVNRYRRLWMERHGYFSMNIVTSRGCPFHCNWCAKPIWGQRYNARSPENVVEELAFLKENFRPDHIWVMDDIMGIRPGWMREFAHLVDGRNALIPYKCLSRADLLLRDGEIEALKRAGCVCVWTGVESGSQKVLDAMDKGIRLDEIRRATSELHAAGIRVGFFLQFGYPGETRMDIEATFRLVRECRPDDIGVSVTYPLPGTRFYDAVREQLGAKQNWEQSADLDMMYRGPFSTAFYRKLHQVLHKEFRIQRAAYLLRQSLRKPGAWSQKHVRELGAIAYHGLTLPVEKLRLELLAR